MAECNPDQVYWVTVDNLISSPKSSSSPAGKLIPPLLTFHLVCEIRSSCPISTFSLDDKLSTQTAI